jgi:thiol-disulfide isomerase/thioredoxin
MGKILSVAAIFPFALVCVPFSAAAAPAEEHVIEAIKSPALTVVHLWAPWCSNCQAELKSGGWLKMVKENPEVRFSVISSEVWQPCTAAEFDLEAMAGLHFAALDRLADYVTAPLS